MWEIGFITRSAHNPGPAEALSAAGESQMNSIRFGFYRTYTHEPAFMCDGSGGTKHANDRRHQSRYEECAHPLFRELQLGAFGSMRPARVGDLSRAARGARTL